MVDLHKKIQQNRERLESSLYTIDNVFQKSEYDWPGDWEGRALLAFCCHAAMTGTQIPCMRQMVEKLPLVTNTYGYFGKPFDGEIADEQQLSGHSWYLRGLIEYYKLTGDNFALQTAKSTIENLYIPVTNYYEKYPLHREKIGGVSGNITGVVNGWRLSSDVGCAYMCVDGVSQYYALTKDEKVKTFLDHCIAVFEKTDFVHYGFQTHTTLSCARGIMTMYQETADTRYLQLAQRVFQTYVQSGMTLTYENYNWFKREDTWTEPCAVVDSLLLAVSLFQATNKEEYRTLARRIWWNGLSFCQRDNGGAGPNSCVKEGQPILQICMFEAPFCCTMRFAEALRCAKENLCFCDKNNKEVVRDNSGRYFIGDKLLVEDLDNAFADAPVYEIDGKQLIEIPTLVSETKARLKVVFS